jgi:outer membrane immunogenic protein
MRWLAAATFAPLVMFASAPVMAADLPVPPGPAVYAPAPVSAVASWSGFYLGANAGGGMSRAQSEFSVAGASFATADTDLSGPAGGVQAGYNWQTGALLVGVETDFQWSNLKGSLGVQCAVCGPATNATIEHDIEWFGTARGRLGYAAGGWLAYLTGGYAYGRAGFNATATGGGVTATLNQGTVQSGWTLGAGTEIALAPHWSAKLEYLYVDFGTISNTIAVAGLPPVSDRTRLQMNVTRLGVNYRF